MASPALGTLLELLMRFFSPGVVNWQLKGNTFSYKLLIFIQDGLVFVSKESLPLSHIPRKPFQGEAIAPTSG